MAILRITVVHMLTVKELSVALKVPSGATALTTPLTVKGMMDGDGTKSQDVLVHRHRRSGLALDAVGVGIQDLDGNGDGRLDARALLVGLPIDIDIGHGRLGREGTRADERERICRIFGDEIGECERIIFKLRLLDAGIEYLFRLNAYFFRQARSADCPLSYRGIYPIGNWNKTTFFTSCNEIILNRKRAPKARRPFQAPP